MRTGSSVLLSLIIAAVLAGCGGSDGPERMTPAEADGFVMHKSTLRDVHCADLPGGGEREFRCVASSGDDQVRLDLGISEDGESITASGCKVLVRRGDDPCARFPVAPRG